MQKAMKALGVVVVGAVAALAANAMASDGASPAEAEAMVKKGVAFIKANGKDKAFAEITKKGGQFSDRDLYLTAVRFDGTVVAHGANEKMLGKVLIDLKDVDGKEFVREMVETAKSKNTYWIDYKFTNPVSKKVEPKTIYCERVDDVALCGGVYKKS